MVDPLDNLIGFYSVVGKKALTGVVSNDGAQSVVSSNQGVPQIAHSTNTTPGLQSALRIHSTELSKNANTGKKPATKKSHHMPSAGSGSESATMIRAFAQKLGPASSLIATSEASTSGRHAGTQSHASEHQEQYTSPTAVARLSYPKGYNAMMQ